METFKPTPLPEEAENQMRRILDMLSPFSLRQLREEVQNGNIDGTWYGGNFEEPMTPERVAEVYAGRSSFQGCFLGWAGFLEQRSVRALLDPLDWFGDRPGDTELELFVHWIRLGDTPLDNSYSLALYEFLNRYIEERNA
jgi:hypothetical protein